MLVKLATATAAAEVVVSYLLNLVFIGQVGLRSISRQSIRRLRLGRS